MRTGNLMSNGLVALIVLAMELPANAQQFQFSSFVRGTFLGVGRGAVQVETKNGPVAVPLRRYASWYVEGKAEPDVLRLGMIVQAEGRFSYSDFYNVREARLTIYAGNCFASYKQAGFNDQLDGGKLRVVGHVVSAEPLRIRATMTDVVGITRSVNGRSSSFPVKGAVFQVQRQANAKTIGVRFGRGQQYVRFAAPAATARIQRNPQTGLAEIITVIRDEVLTVEDLPEAKQKNGKQKAKKAGKAK